MKKNSAFDMNKFAEDKISAIDAKFEAQKIAFAPLCFQAIRALLEFGIMQAISDSGDAGISIAELCKKTLISEYGIKVPAVIQSGNVFACQFHPEKSGVTGLKIIENFCKL